MNNLIFQNSDGLIMQDIENNTFLVILEECYLSCGRFPPEFIEIYDRCLEYSVDNMVKTASYKGIIMSIHAILNILEDILTFESYAFKKDNMLYNAEQILMFEELLYE